MRDTGVLSRDTERTQAFVKVQGKRTGQELKATKSLGGRAGVDLDRWVELKQAAAELCGCVEVLELVENGQRGSQAQDFMRWLQLEVSEVRC